MLITRISGASVALGLAVLTLLGSALCASSYGSYEPGELVPAYGLKVNASTY